ncbi:TolC family protein [Billgrantia zhangzhouensis]|uniref:TolC family protein n=1 Tax=Billgrantia zhangzhouensis TaxID=2733481 RepID=UPI001F1C10CC|nr:TolC family protein [Halomonas zhangzhouensis]
MNKRRYTQWAAGLLTLGVLSAPGAWALTLAEAVHQGLAIHPAVSAAEAEAMEAATQVGIARDGYWPNLQASAGPENSLWGDVGYDITAAQMLYDWGRVRSRVENAEAAQRQRLEALKATSDEAALDIVETYLDVLHATQRLVVVDAHIERLEALAGVSRRRSQGGFVGRGEVERVELELARAGEQRSLARGDLRDAALQFRELVERSPEALDWPSPPPWLEALRRPERLEAALEEAPLLGQAREALHAARAEARERRAARLPQLNLEGSLLRREIGGRMEEDAVVALRLRMEPLQGLSSARQVTAAQQRIEAAQWSRHATRRDLRRQLASLLELDEMIGWRLQAVEAQLASADEVAVAYQEQFEVGLRDIADLLTVARDRFEAKRQHTDLQTERLRIPYRAAAQLGQLAVLLEK